MDINFCKRMLRLHEFITIIRNTKTIAEQRAEYQKEMAAIRESFGKNQQSLRPRNVTKLLFINMSGQQTNFGQMQCLNLITANSLIQKRIGYLGLTQLFHEKSELLMMATNRLKIDLGSVNNSIVGLVLCVISQICTTQLARELHNQVLKCIGNNNAYIRKKAILTAIRIIKKCPEYISSFLPKIISCLQEKNHGVLLSCMAFLQNVLYQDQSYAKQLGNAMPRILKLYRLVVQQHNTQYEIGGVQDPFLQVAILKFLRILKKHTDQFDKTLVQILVTCHDNVCSRVTNNLKNGANAVLLQCFQLFMMMQQTNQLKQMVSNVLTKFISVKDANTKYLSLFNLNLMSKYDLSVVKCHRGTIFECLNQNDNLIRNMALDLLYMIAQEDNASSIVKELLNTLLTATDQEFIPELALKICLIVQKHSQSRRWHFDTILKVLILADQSVKQQSAKSLVHLITSTPQLQDYCMAKLFFSTCENIQNDALAKLCLYLLGEIGQILLKNKDLNVSQVHILDLIESIVFRIGVAFDTITYALSTLLKLYQKFPSERERISKMIKSFETHSDLQVQKRACEYSKLLESEWNHQRNTEICIPIPPFRETAQAFKIIPVGQTRMDIDLKSIKLPKKINVNYEEHLQRQEQTQKSQRQVVITTGKQTNQKTTNNQKKSQNIFESITQVQQPKAVFSKKKQVINIMDDDIFNTITRDTPNNQPITNNPVKQNTSVVNDDPFGLLSLNVGSNQSSINNQFNTGSSNVGGFDMNLLGFSNTSQTQPIQPQNNNSLNGNSLLGNDFLGLGGSQQVPTQNTGFNMNPSTNQTGGFNWNQQAPTQNIQNPQVHASKILAYENSQIQIWMKCIKQTNDTTKITANYTNKTQSAIENLSIAAAVMKHLKLTLNPLNTTTIPPMSNDVVNQTMTVINSAVGQKGIVMKVKIGYNSNGQKFSFEQKLSNFPSNM